MTIFPDEKVLFNLPKSDGDIIKNLSMELWGEMWYNKV